MHHFDPRLLFSPANYLISEIYNLFPCNIASSKHLGSWENTSVALGNNSAAPRVLPTSRVFRWGYIARKRVIYSSIIISWWWIIFPEFKLHYLQPRKFSAWCEQFHAQSTRHEVEDSKTNSSSRLAHMTVNRKWIQPSKNQTEGTQSQLYWSGRVVLVPRVSASERVDWKYFAQSSLHFPNETSDSLQRQKADRYVRNPPAQEMLCHDAFKMLFRRFEARGDR